MSAGAQGRFFEMDELIFRRQREIVARLGAKAKTLGKPAGSERSEEVQREVFIDLAAELDLDAEQVRQDLEARAYQDRVRREATEAARLGVSGTPGSFINGRYVSGAQPIQVFKAKIDEEIGWAKNGDRPKFPTGTTVAQLRSSQRRRGPDPNKVYDLKAGLAPAQGPSGAKVTILHYLDYQ